MPVAAFAVASLVMTFLQAMALMSSARADDQFYKGKTLRLLVGQPAGGGYDTYARLLAEFLPKFLPGQPAVVVQNMPGAGSLAMANYIYNQATHDGLVIGLGGGTIATAGLLGTPGARFDSRRFSWIGSMNNEVGLTVSWHDAPIQQTRDIFEKEFLVAGAGANSDSVIFPNAVNRVLSTKFKIVSGYQGSAEMVLAMERGEVQGIGNWHYSSILANKPDWLRDKKIAPLLQLGLKRHAAMPEVPGVLDIARTDDEKDILRLVFAQQSVGRPIIGPPEAPPEATEILRHAFDAIMQDAQLQAEADKRGIEINDPMSGAEALALVTRLYESDPKIIAAAVSAIKPSQ